MKVERLHVLSDVELTDTEKAVLVASLCERMRDVLEVMPPGQPATCMRHGDDSFAAPGVNLRELKRERSGERGRS